MKSSCDYFEKRHMLVCFDECKYSIDENIKSAIDNWIKYGLNPGTCTRLLLEGKYLKAYDYAHPLIKPHWKGHVVFVEKVSLKYRGKNMEKHKLSFKGKTDELGCYT